MGDELCCSKQEEMDNQNLNKPETIITSFSFVEYPGETGAFFNKD